MKKLEKIVGALLVLAFLALVFAACAVYVTERYWDGYFDGYHAATGDLAQERTGRAEDDATGAGHAAQFPQGNGYALIPLTKAEADKLDRPERMSGDSTSSAAQSAAPSPRGEGEDADAERMAVVIYQEAGSDWISDETRRMVADVVLNRVADERFPDTIEGVLLEKWQYGMLWQTGIVWPERASQAGEQAAVERARRIAEEVLSGEHSALYGEGYVFQAEFGQGAEGFWQDGIYFGR